MVGADDERQGTSLPTVADGYQLALAVAGLDPIPLGVRPAGPLDWSPAEADTSRVADARRSELARRKLRAIAAERRAGRMTRWLEVAA